jgi:transposase
MNIIAQNGNHRMRMMKYCKGHGVTKTAERYKISRKTVYKWLGRYDGTPESLMDRSHRPLSPHPRSHTEAEYKLIRRELKKHRWTDLLLAYQRLQEKGYTRSYGGFKRVAVKLRGKKANPKKLKRKPKPYSRAECPGEKVQVDVKMVPGECIADGKKYYQFTAIDECTRWTHRQMYDDKSSYSAKLFLEELITKAPFPIKRIQTDNGTEFTNTLLVTVAKHKALFEQALEDMGIEYQRIRIATPRHNGKVERQHRTDQERFYSRLRMFCLTDGRKQMAAYNVKSNGYIKTCLNMRSPHSVLADYLAIM